MLYSVVCVVLIKITSTHLMKSQECTIDTKLNRICVDCSCAPADCPIPAHCPAVAKNTRRPFQVLMQRGLHNFRISNRNKKHHRRSSQSQNYAWPGINHALGKMTRNERTWHSEDDYNSDIGEVNAKNDKGHVTNDYGSGPVSVEVIKKNSTKKGNTQKTNESLTSLSTEPNKKAYIMKLTKMHKKRKKEDINTVDEDNADSSANALTDAILAANKWHNMIENSKNIREDVQQNDKNTPFVDTFLAAAFINNQFHYNNDKENKQKITPVIADSIMSKMTSPAKIWKPVNKLAKISDHDVKNIYKNYVIPNPNIPNIKKKLINKVPVKSAMASRTKTFTSTDENYKNIKDEVASSIGEKVKERNTTESDTVLAKMDIMSGLEDVTDRNPNLADLCVEKLFFTSPGRHTMQTMKTDLDSSTQDTSYIIDTDEYTHR